MHQINISFVLIKEGAVLELCTSASSEGERDVMSSVHEAGLVSCAFASLEADTPAPPTCDAGRVQALGWCCLAPQDQIRSPWAQEMLP